jgi:hypothetical protein
MRLLIFPWRTFASFAIVSFAVYAAKSPLAVVASAGLSLNPVWAFLSCLLRHTGHSRQRAMRVVMMPMMVAQSAHCS